MSAIDLFPKADGAKNIGYYKATLQFTHLLVGGVPSDPKIVRAWIKQRLDLGDAELEDLIAETAKKRETVLSPEEALDVAMASPLAGNVNGFKRDLETRELMIEGRTIKAALKEYANSAYPHPNGFPTRTKYFGEKFKKILRSVVEEKVTVEEILIGTGVKEDEVLSEWQPGAVAWVEDRIKHVTVQGKPHSAISRVEVIERPTVSFTIKVIDDFISPEMWGRIWIHGEGIGTGSDRGRSDGKYELVNWEKIK